MHFVCKVNLTVSCFTTNASRVGHTSPVNRPLQGGRSVLHKECGFRNAHLTAVGVRSRLHQWSEALSTIFVGSIWKLKQINGLPFENVAGYIQWRQAWHRDARSCGNERTRVRNTPSLLPSDAKALSKVGKPCGEARRELVSPCTRFCDETI